MAKLPLPTHERSRFAQKRPRFSAHFAFFMEQPSDSGVRHDEPHVEESLGQLVNMNRTVA